MLDPTLTLARPGTWAVFGGVSAVLVFASLVGLVLKRAVAHGQPHPVIDNLNARVNAWWVMVGAIALAFALEQPGVTGLFLLISFCALREFVTLLPTRRADHLALTVSFFLVLPLHYYFIWRGWSALFTAFMPVFAFLALPALSALGGDSRDFLARAAKLQWALMICVYCISHVPALMLLDLGGAPDDKLLLIAFLVIVVQGSDVLQYVWGKLFGRHRLAPRLSPSKTWEGLIGGIASATALGAALAPITPFSSAQAGALALLLCLMGFAGGLVMSAIKRDRGVKDWGQLISGHGGMLGRLDSLVFAAPVFYYVLKFGWGQ